MPIRSATKILHGMLLSLFAETATSDDEGRRFPPFFLGSCWRAVGLYACHRGRWSPGTEGRSVPPRRFRPEAPGPREGRDPDAALQPADRASLRRLDSPVHRLPSGDAPGTDGRIRGLAIPHLADVRLLHARDLARGFGRVVLPFALDRKYPNAATEWRWQFVFPAGRAGITKRVGPHTMRHSFATSLLEDGYDIRTVQELLGHRDVRTTMTYLHVMNRGALGVKSPMDRM